VEALSQLIFAGSALVLVSIFAGMASSRFGAPLLLVFLGLGMLAGPAGAGVRFERFDIAFLVGSVALAVVLFDGGLRTPREAFRLATRPALALATVGVLATVAIIAVFCHLMLGFAPVEAILVGAIVAPTDAAAVFFLLNVRGVEIQRRVRATLEIESGVNDPMAVFLVLGCVELLRAGSHATVGDLALLFVVQMAGGALIGVAGGRALVAVINRIDIASGLYPIFALAAALAVFGGAQTVGASGFLAVYIVGVIVGTRRHRATRLINRFHDGLAWLSQIVMFLMLGLLVTPSRLQWELAPALGVVAVLMLVARPAAVALCLTPFRFNRREMAFVAWVGLRGAVPIFLATMPILADLPDRMTYFSIAAVVVLASLAIQGWTVVPAAKLLGLELPSSPESIERGELDTTAGIDRDIAGYRVADGCPALLHAYAALPLPERTRVISVIRQGTVMDRAKLAKLEPDDYVLTVAPPEQIIVLDRLFAPPPSERSERRAFGEFALKGDVPVDDVAVFYGFTVRDGEHGRDLAAFVAGRVKRQLVAGDRVGVGGIELIVRQTDGGRAVDIGIELEPEAHGLLPRLKRWLGRTGVTD
jgi:potassium/hydrogen antiporter